MAASYLYGHYDLSKTTVLSNGDGGSGYQFQDFEQMVEGCLDHQHFRDCYHVHEKIQTRLSFCFPHGKTCQSDTEILIKPKPWR